ncbi:MAG: universal stress protein [Micromonosporaceae bacterium]|jgi:nucleotide-binding universal stress UspA family protein
MNERPVVAGVDGSPPSVIAAEHAAAAAVALGVPLRLVHGYLHPGTYGVALSPYDLTPPPAPEEGEGFLGDLAAQLRTTHPGLTVTARQVLGGAAAALLAESEDASLLVVGSRGLGGFSGMLLGSVSAHVVAHARCPVLVVRPPAPPAARQDAPVIAGVDGSPGSLRAVRYAAGEAVRRGRNLILVHAGVGAAESDRNRAQALLDEAAREAVQADPAVRVSTEIRYGADAADGMVEASKQAAVVVVGSRGRGGFLGLLLGSISQALVHHAHGPVLVVPPRVAEDRLVPAGGDTAVASAGPDRR